MQHLRIRTTTAGAIVYTGVVLLIFRLINHAVNDDVIHLHIAIALIIGKVNSQLARGIGADGVIHHAGTECPGLNGLSTDLQAHALVADNATHAHSNGIAATTTT